MVNRQITDVAELDRFDAMISIRKEIEAASTDEPNNVLKNASYFSDVN
jgi:glycine dehydrogenase